MPIDGALNQRLNGFSCTWVLLNFLEPELRNRELENPSNLAGHGQEIVKEETLCAFDVFGGHVSNALGRRLVPLWIFSLHGASLRP